MSTLHNTVALFLMMFSLGHLTSGDPRKPPVVSLAAQGQLMGFHLKMFRTQRIVAYLGIPYALPPIGDRRFQPPVVDNLPRWEGLRNASDLQPECWGDHRRQVKQHEEAFARLIGTPKKWNAELYDEDCLYLNVYTPEEPPPTDGYAVLVWLHSGDFNTGNTSELNPFHLVFKQKLIVVTVAYRMGLFGFFTSMDGEAAGNYGLMDQSAALLWINLNIRQFGGNDKQVTLMGHGAGAVSTSLHLTSGDWSADLFNRAIIMSGTLLAGWAVREPRSYAQDVNKVAQAFGCNRRPTASLLVCLRRVEAQTLLEGSPLVNWGPIVDEGLSNTTTPFVPNNPRALVEKPASLRKVPILVGFTNMEESLDVSMGELMEDGVSSDTYDTLVGDIILNELSQLDTNDSCGGNSQAVLDALNFVYKPYPPISDPLVLRQKYIDFSTERNYAAPTVMLAMHTSRMADTYVYRFDIKPNTMAANEGLPAWAGVPHRYDLVFVWGLPYWVALDNQTQWDSADKRVSDIIMTMWANFAKFGNPTKMGVYIKWDLFTPQNQGVLIVDRSFNMSDSHSLNFQAVQFWNDYYPKVVDYASQCCNVSDYDSAGRAATGSAWLILIGLTWMMLFGLVEAAT